MLFVLCGQVSNELSCTAKAAIDCFNLQDHGLSLHALLWVKAAYDLNFLGGLRVQLNNMLACVCKMLRPLYLGVVILQGD